MSNQLDEQYRLIHGHLYQRQGDAFMHVAVVPNYARKALAVAVAWFESIEDND